MGEKENEKAEAGKKAVLSDLAQGGGNWGVLSWDVPKVCKKKDKERVKKELRTRRGR